MEIDKYLPIGTIVILKNTSKRVMITGFAITSSDNSGEIYDYIGCFYPEGVISTEKNIVFNHNQIDELSFMGYMDEEWIVIERKLKEIMENGDNLTNINLEKESEQQLGNQNVTPIQNVTSVS